MLSREAKRIKADWNLWEAGDVIITDDVQEIAPQFRNCKGEITKVIRNTDHEVTSLSLRLLPKEGPAEYDCHVVATDMKFLLWSERPSDKISPPKTPADRLKLGLGL
jgi:hypothetical protein